MQELLEHQGGGVYKETIRILASDYQKKLRLEGPAAKGRLRRAKSPVAREKEAYEISFDEAGKRWKTFDFMEAAF